MNNKEKLFHVANKFQAIAQENNCANAERWLNIAYKLDYISLSHKEKIELLLKKIEEIERFGVEHSVSETDVIEMTTIAEIASNTKFSQNQLRSLNRV